MALAPDTLFEKFGFWSADDSDSDCCMDSPNSMSSQENDASLANLLASNDITSDPFDDLDLNVAESALDDLLACSMIKQEPLIDIKDEPLEDTDIFGALAAVEQEEASLDSIKSDCMWSSALMIDGNNPMLNQRKRRRDVSLTLSECAEGILALKDFDVDMLSKVESSLGATPALGSSPQFMSSFGASFEDTPMATSEDDTSTASDDDFLEDDLDEDLEDLEEEEASEEEEEIDVVSTDLGGSSARTRHAAFNRSNKKTAVKIEAGRSLLKKPPQAQQLTDKHRTILDHAYSDHSYFLARPGSTASSTTLSEDSKPYKGMLTPNESSDDDEVDNNSRLLNTGTTTIITTSQFVDKRKIAEAVQCLINNNTTNKQTGGSSSDGSNIKFKFRMKFKSTKNSNGHHGHGLKSSTAKLMEEKRERRKSASKNAYCPPPNSTCSTSARSSPVKHSNSNSNSNSNSSNSSNSSSQHKRSSSSLLSSKRSSASASSSPESSSMGGLGGGDKCREIRDLHNSMERQRRVELRNNFDLLKELVPELADADKASKLTILKKAMDYCHLLSTMDIRMRRDKEREASRNAMLKKRLLEASQRHDRRTSTSGRVTGWQHRF
jgi:hypothetical protein